MWKRKALILEAPKKVSLREEMLPELAANQVLVRSRLSAFKHGTEMEAYYGSSPFQHKNLDPQWRVFQENREGTASILYPGPLGNMTVGVVEKVGSEVRSLAVGDQVFGWLPIADWHVAPAERLYLLAGLTPEQALCIDPANFALGGVLDGDVCYPDQVLITGLGAIGLLAVQYCKLRGAKVYASSSFDLRRQLALDYGADVVLDRREVEDFGLEIKQMTDGGVDVALECSGQYAQLQQALRATRQCGRVVCVGFYSGAAKDLYLGEEFFHNRLTLLASLPDAFWNNPVRTEPPRHAQELKELIIADFKAKRLKIAGILGPEYPFNEAVAAVKAIANHPKDVIKVAIAY